MVDPPVLPGLSSPQRRAALADALLGGGLALIAFIEIWLPLPSTLGDGSRTVSTVVSLWACAWLTLRRWRPLLSHVLALSAWQVAYLASDPVVLFWGGFVVYGVSTYSVARHAGRQGGALGGVIMAAAMLYLDLTEPLLQDVSEIVFHWSVLSVAWLLGRGALERDLRATRSETRAELAESQAALRAAEAVSEERARIAREMHDLVAHSVSVMVVQAGAATQVVEHDPVSARAALESIRTTGTQALEEMRRLVGVLRDDGPKEGATADLTPQPGTSAIAELVAQTRTAGLRVELTVEGESASMSPGVDLAAYRIVQEALSNVRQHSGASLARVQLRHRPHGLEIEVRDDGSGGMGGVAGHGLLGMRERAGLYGGSLTASGLPGGGFLVRAVLPVADGPT